MLGFLVPKSEERETEEEVCDSTDTPQNSRKKRFISISGSPNRAREILQLGFYMRAIPVSVLNKASDELEARLLRDSLRKSGSDMEDDNDDLAFADDDELPARQTFARLRGIGGSQVAPVVRIPSGPPGVLKSKGNKKNNFEIYVDSTSEVEADSGSKDNVKSITDELSADPDYQVRTLSFFLLSGL